MILSMMIPGLGGKVITGLQILNILTSFHNEKNPDTRTQYSKFIKNDKPNSINASAKTMISSQAGMMIIYTPALLMSIFVTTYSGKDNILPLPMTSPAATLCYIHFAKRCLEVLLLHKYSGTVELMTSSAIGIFYMLTTLLICSVANKHPSEVMSVIGTGLFAVGIVGNFYHHYLLARLRALGDSSSKKRYVAPKGGLFDYVAAPHYLFELIGWLGVSLVATHVNVFLVFLGMCSYLGGRAVSQNEFNRQTFPENWPVSRKNILPFLF